MNTLAEPDFESVINAKFEEYEEKIVMRKELKVNATPEFVELYKNAKFVPRKFIYHQTWFLDQRGRFYHYLSTKRKKTRAQMESDEKENKEKIDKLQKERAELQDQLLTLSQELEDMKRKEEEFYKDSQKLDNLYATGLIDEEGNIKE